jgi:hypothetical protein
MKAMVATMTGDENEEDIGFTAPKATGCRGTPTLANEMQSRWNSLCTNEFAKRNLVVHYDV